MGKFFIFCIIATPKRFHNGKKWKLIILTIYEGGTGYLKFNGGSLALCTYFVTVELSLTIGVSNSIIVDKTNEVQDSVTGSVSTVGIANAMLCYTRNLKIWVFFFLTRRRIVLSLRWRMLFTVHEKKTAQWCAFFVYCSEIKVLVKRKNDSPVNHLSFWLYEGIKNKAFLHVWFSKVLLLEISKEKKQLQKKNFVDSNAKSAKKKQNACFIFAFLSKHV